MPVNIYYFDARGLMEPVRWMLSYADIEFNDIRAPLPAYPTPLPPEIKAKSRWGQVPFAENPADGKTLCQSAAVTRYFAKKAKLVPEDPYLAALCDEYVDAIKDCATTFLPLALNADVAEKETKLKELLKTNKAKYFDVLESLLVANGGKYLVGDSLTWADIYLAHWLDNIKILLDIDVADGQPNLKNLKETVVNIPKIKAWIQKRPQTKF